MSIFIARNGLTLSGEITLDIENVIIILTQNQF